MIVSTTTTQALQEALRNKAGVSPSQHWLNDCLEYLQAATTNNIHNNIDPSIVLEQILHHDLRDVVRELLSDDASPELCAATTSTHQPLHPSLLLRQALHNSTQSSHQYQATLPSHFRLLVQMEEVLDVSQNAEARYSLGPTSFHDVAPIGNQQHRVLKFALSDGYNNHENSGIRNSNHDTQSSLFVGMEYRGSGAAILSSLSAHSRAGIKMILQGPLKCRHGILLLNEANTHVLGGYVPHLLEMQQQALQQARTLAGVGVDPTIKALIGNNPTAVDEEQGTSVHFLYTSTVLLYYLTALLLTRVRSFMMIYQTKEKWQVEMFRLLLLRLQHSLCAKPFLLSPLPTTVPR